MNYVKWTGLAVGALALGAVAPALAHHSHAMFDHTQEVTITGKVLNFAYVNPHGSLDIEVMENGQPVKYWVEMSNLTNMVARGITPRTFQPGDTITVHMNPLKDGRPGCNYLTIDTPDGKTYE